MASIIFAADESNGIGYKGKLPWIIPEELQKFKDLTWGHTIIMGRKTYESLPNQQALINRHNYIVSASNDIYKGNVGVFYTLYGAIGCSIRNHPDSFIFFIGGSRIFQEALDEGFARQIYFTRIHAVHRCDTFFSLPNYICEWDKTILEQNDKFTRFLFTKKEN